VLRLVCSGSWRGFGVLVFSFVQRVFSGGKAEAEKSFSRLHTIPSLNRLSRKKEKKDLTMISEITRFLEFQSLQRGILPLSSACNFSSCSKPTMLDWIERGVVKSFLHCGRHYVGVDSLRQWLQLRGLVVEAEGSRRKRVARRHQIREAENRKITE